MGMANILREASLSPLLLNTSGGYYVIGLPRNMSLLVAFP